MSREIVYPSDLLGAGNDFNNIIKINLIGVSPSVVVTQGAGNTNPEEYETGEKKRWLVDKAKNAAKAVVKAPGAIGSGVVNAYKGDLEIGLTSEKRNTHTSIYLPAPMVLAFAQAIHYDSDGVGGFNNLSNQTFANVLKGGINSFMKGEGPGAMADLMKDMFAGPIDAIAGLGSQELKNATELRMRAVRNPHMKVLFRGPTFRQFQFAFSMVPFEDSDSEAIREIIRALTHAAAPDYANRFNGNLGADNWFAYPDEVEIEILIKDPVTGELRENEYVQRFNRCVATEIATTYGGNSMYTTHETGAPMDVVLNIGVMETVYMTKERAKSAFYGGEKGTDDEAKR